MYKVALWTPRERADLFIQSSLRKGTTAYLIEKDFWVCWVLAHLFPESKRKPRLLFKGGTSLSKAFGAINRFSEDIDIALDRHDLGYSGAKDPLGVSRTQSKLLVPSLVADLAKYLESTLLQDLKETFRTALETNEGWGLGYEVVEGTQTIFFSYPRSLHSESYGAGGCITPNVRMEFVAKADHFPQGRYPISPYAAETHPDVFDQATCEVDVLKPERTFWEKAITLHAWAHRPQSERGKIRESRHYSDIIMLDRASIATTALNQPEVFSAAWLNQDLFFRKKWSSLNTAVPPTFRLLPNKDGLALLREDYREMRDMFFSEPVSFEELLEGLRELEERINELNWKLPART